jgi:hypothetical protein
MLIAVLHGQAIYFQQLLVQLQLNHLLTNLLLN